MQSTDENSTEESAPTPQPAGKRLRRWIVVLTGIVLLPSLVTVTGIGARGLKWVHPELARVTEFKRLTLHWWAPLECAGLRIGNTRDWSNEAPPLLTIRRITTQQPLWQVAWSLGRGVDISVVQPELNLVNSQTGSNLTDAMEDLGGHDRPGSTSFPLRVNVVNGQINFASPNPDPSISESRNPYVVERLVSGIHCRISTLDPTTFLPDLSLVAMLGNGESDSAAGIRGLSSGNTTVDPRIAARLDHLAADFQPLKLEMPQQDSESSDPQSVAIKLGPVGDNTQRAMRFVARGLKLDVLEPLIAQVIPGVRCHGLLSVQGELLMLGKSPEEGFALRAAARATDVAWRQASWEPSESLQMSTASVDCAVAVARDGIIVQTLSANCPFATVDGDGEIRLPTGRLVKGILNSAELSDPDRASVISEAEAAAAGQVNISGQVDLVAISRMLPQTLRLREGLELTEGSVRFAVRTQSQESSADGLQTLNWQAFVESSPIVARHDRKTVRWDAPVRLQCSGPLQMSSAELSIATLSGDFGQMQVRPIEDALDIHGSINVDRLWDHVGQFIDSPPPGIRGEVRVDAHVGMPPSGDVVVRDLKLRADNLWIESDHLAVRIDQPLLKMLEGQLSVKGTGAAIRGLVVPWTDLAWLAQESQVTVQLDAAPPQRLTIVGEVRPGSLASISTGSWQNSSALLINQAQLALDIDTDSQADHYVIRSGKLKVPGFEAQLSGTLGTAGKWMTTQLEVDADYDLAVLSRMALNDPEGDIRLSGKKHSRLTVRGTPAFWDGTGPADAEPLEVSGEIGWDEADVYGVQLGPGTAPFRLKDGQIQTEPIRCSLNGGKLVALVNYDLRQNHLALASGSRVENIVVTEQVAKGWLGHVAPFLAGAAGVQGSVSARVSQFLYRLDRPESSNITATVDIHGITATPGSSLSLLLQALDTLRPDRRSLARDLTIPRQKVQCELRNGMITHDQLLLTLSGYNLKSRGAVDLNGQLNLTLDVPLEKSDDRRSGRTVSVPVRGTVTQPQIDIGRIVKDAGAQRIQGEINNQLDRGLNQLFNKLR